MYPLEPWSVGGALHPLLSFTAALIWGLFILCYPPPNSTTSISLYKKTILTIRNSWRKLSIIVLALPLWYSFTCHLDLLPSYTLTDTFGRFLYIWWAHMSNVICIMEYAPTPVADKLAFRDRLSQAYEVLFSIRLETPEQRRQNCGHTYTRLQFFVRQTFSAVANYYLMEAWDYFMISWSPEIEDYIATTRYGALHAFLNDDPWILASRVEAFMEWNLIALFMYEWIYSSFAVLFVGILRLDEPQDWRMTLCGPFTEAWNVRRYWGKHWHSYIYKSFTAHTKIVTRQWGGMVPGKWITRMVENTSVFVLSGAAHALVRWAQDPNDSCLAIMWWYIAQMLPIIVEGAVQAVWQRARNKLGIRPDNVLMNTCEYTVGYAWMTAWFMFSIPVYGFFREQWSMGRMWQLEAEYREQVAAMNGQRSMRWMYEHAPENATTEYAEGFGYFFGLQDTCLKPPQMYVLSQSL